MPPPVLRRLVLISTAAVMLVGVFLAGDARFSRAQATVDYDTDNDGLIEVSTREQLLAIHYDLNTDGIPETRASWQTATAWATALSQRYDRCGLPPPETTTTIRRRQTRRAASVTS